MTKFTIGRPALARTSAVLVLALTPVAALASDVASVRKNGKLVMITGLSESGEIFRQRQEKGAQYGGLDRDLVDSFARSLGVKVEHHVSKEFSQLFPDLIAGKGEIVAASLTITEERKRVVEFSAPYLWNRLVVVARSDSGIDSPQDLAGKRAITIAGTTLERELARIPGVKTQITRFHQEFYPAVNTKKADFFLGDGVRVLNTMARYPELHIAYTYPESQNFGFAMRKGSDLRPLFDAHLEKLRKTGELFTMMERYYAPAAVESIRSWE